MGTGLPRHGGGQPGVSVTAPDGLHRNRWLRRDVPRHLCLACSPGPIAEGWERAPPKDPGLRRSDEARQT